MQMITLWINASDVWLMSLTIENINLIEWVFNHKETAIKILQQYVGKEYYE